MGAVTLRPGWYRDGVYLRRDTARYGEPLALVVAPRGDGRYGCHSGSRLASKPGGGTTGVTSAAIVDGPEFHGSEPDAGAAMKHMDGWCNGV